MTDGATPQAGLLECYELAQAARSGGDLAIARAHLEAGLTQAPENPPAWLKLLEAEVLRDEGRLVEARSVLEALRISHPDNFWAAFHLASLARKEGDFAAARGHLDAALLQSSAAGNVWLKLLEADLLRDEGREAEAKVALERTVLVFPDNMWLHQRLGQIAEERGDLGVARAHLEAALQIDGSHLDLHLAVVRFLSAEGMTEAATRRLEALRDRFGDDMRVLLPLMRAYQAARQPELERACLADAVTTNPLDPGLLRHLFATRARSVGVEKLTAVTDRLRAVLGNDLADELLIITQLQAMQFHQALQAIRRRKKTRNSPAEVASLATALFGVHAYKTGWRYLRFCLKRWPDSQALWSIYVTQGLRQGRLDEVARRLNAAQGRLAEHVILTHRFMLCGFRGDLDGAIDCYALLRKLGQDKPAHRSVLGKLIYTRQDLMTAEALFARIGNPGAEDTPLLHRGGLVGMMTLEFDLERRDLAKTGGYASLADWVRARPGSTIAAVRLIDDWSADQGGQGAASSAAAVPKQIFQYWDNPDRPEALAPMVASWAAAPGFEHRLMDRIDALRFLRETMGPDWVRAFQLAQNAAQEADLLRLCLLAQQGGVWADADDYLYGDLQAVLAQGRGLILYREPLGGALANNIMAAPPGHPVVIYAAQLARQILLQRANENAWNKTGPGLLMRAVAHYLIKAGPTEARRQITILDWPSVAHQISAHNPVRYKASVTYWNRSEVRTSEDLVWAKFLAALLPPPDTG